MKKTDIWSMIVAYDKNRGIGFENQLPWGKLLPADMKHFVDTTTGKTVLMGRKTYESIPNTPLKNRMNIVITSNKDASYEGVTVINSMSEAENLDIKGGELVVIGGARVYEEFLPFVDKLYITEVDDEFDVDTYFPALDKSTWELSSEESHSKDEKNKFNYKFLEYTHA